MFDGVIVANNRYDEKDDFGEGDLGTTYDAVAFGRAFLANPDLPARYMRACMHVHACEKKRLVYVLLCEVED